MARAVTEEIAPGVHLLTLGRGVMASNAYLVRARTGRWALVDAGWRGSARHIDAAAERLLGTARPAAILLTHIHPDHSGAAGELARAWDVPVLVHADELVMTAGRHVPERTMPLDRWLVVPLMKLLPAARREAVEAAGDITDVVRPVDAGTVPLLPDWECVPTPGHTPGHAAYLRRSDGVLISGDAVLTVDLNSVVGAVTGRPTLAGPPRITTWDRAAAQRSLEAVAALRPRILAPGHGRPVAFGVTSQLTHLARHRGAQAVPRPSGRGTPARPVPGLPRPVPGLPRPAPGLPRPARGAAGLPGPARGVAGLPGPARGLPGLPGPARGVTGLSVPGLQRNGTARRVRVGAARRGGVAVVRRRPLPVARPAA